MKKILVVTICFFVVQVQAQLKSAEELCSQPLKYKKEITEIPNQIKDMALCQGALRLGACIGVTGAVIGGAAAYAYSDIAAKRAAFIEAKTIENMAPRLAQKDFKKWQQSRTQLSPEQMQTRITDLQKELDHYSSNNVAGVFDPIGKIQPGKIVDVPRSSGGTSQGLVESILGDQASVSFTENGVTKYKLAKISDLKSTDLSTSAIRELRLEIAFAKKSVSKGEGIPDPQYAWSNTGDELINLNKVNFDQLPEAVQEKYIAKSTVNVTKYFADVKAGKVLKLPPEAFEAAEKEAPSLLEFVSKSPRALVILKSGGILAANVLAAVGFAMTTTNTACDNSGDRFINTDADNNCKPVYKIDQNVASFIDMPKSERDKELLGNRSVCEFDVNLRNTLYARPQLNENQVQCKSDGIKLTTLDGTAYEVSYYTGTKNIKRIVETKWKSTGEAKIGAAPEVAIANLGIEGDFKEGANSVEVFESANKFIPEVEDCCMARGDEQKKCWQSLSTPTFASLPSQNNSRSSK